MSKHKVLFVVSVSFLLAAMPGCAKKRMSDRDTRREQIRNTAETKRQELMPAAGLYRGSLKQDSFSQDVTLKLEVKDIPDTSTGEVDPVLVPILTGSLRLTYGNAETGEFYSFGVQKADFDKDRQKIDVLVTNEQHSEIVISLNRNDGLLEGTWNAPASSAFGDLELRRSEPFNLQATNLEIRGVYAGVLAWDSKDVYQSARLTLSTVQDKADFFTISGNITLSYSDSTEPLSYSLDQVEFNPITRQISLKSSSADIYFIGKLEFGKLVGNWFSKQLGKLGTANFQKNGTPSVPNGTTSIQPLGGNYNGYALWDSLRAYQKITLDIVATYSGQGVLKLNATGKFNYGAGADGEQLLYKFDNVAYNPASNYTVFTASDSEITIKGYFKEGDFEGEWFTATRGRMGTLSASQKHAPSIPTNHIMMSSIKGSYQGKIKNTSDQTNLPENFMIGLVTTPDLGSPNGIKLTGNVRFYLGPFGSLEYTEASCEFVQFGFYSRQLVCKLPANLGITVKGDLKASSIQGELYHDSLNQIATFTVEKTN